MIIIAIVAAKLSQNFHNENCCYHNEAISLPVAFEIVQKLQKVSDSKTGKAKFVSEESKNEMMRQMLKVCCQNRLKFRASLKKAKGDKYEKQE